MLPNKSRNLTLFGFKSWSGVAHEVDGALRATDIGIHFEFKAYEQEIVKDQIMSFNEKSIDYYFSIVSHKEGIRLHRIFVSDSPLDDNAARLCYLWSIIHVTPDVLPIPVILDYFRDPIWEDRIEWILLSEAERILPRFMQPLNSNLKPIRRNVYSLSIPDTTEINEVQDAHVQMSNELLETIECYEPDHFENYTSMIMDKIGPK